MDEDAQKQYAKEKISELIKKFDGLSKTTKNNYNEANTRKDFVIPLFHALGWDVYNARTSNEVVEEEATISGRIDYSFRLNNTTQFLVEAKSIPEDLDKLTWANQAVEYGWNKGISWVVLTDFEGMKLFNSDWKVEIPRANLEISYGDYLNRFDDLWLLSKFSFEKGLLDKTLSKFGITAKREPVNKILADDLVEWREILRNNLSQWNPKTDEKLLFESIQRILDRLIFIRVVEDRGLEDKVLWQSFQKWKTNNFQPYNFIEQLIPIFRKFDETYNSNLFQRHFCETLNTEGDPFRTIIPALYGNVEGGVKYRFDAIDADVFGEVYEQYLGILQKKEDIGSKRKKQGVYYTPREVVDHLVRNTLGEYLKTQSQLSVVESVRILDPACGSGSFLIKAFNLLDEHLRRSRQTQDDAFQSALRKYRILRENVYGVDLDDQAIEISRLNLLLQALVPNNKLPVVGEHIRVGNSLVDDKAIDERAFDWSLQFPDVVKGGGFDIIIGNPPYVSFYSRQSQADSDTKRQLTYLIDKYGFIQDKSKLGRFNTLMFFLEKGLELLKENGYLGFIVDNNIHSNPSMDIRKFIADNSSIITIIDELKVFEDVGSGQLIIVLKKKRPGNNHKISWISMDDDFVEIGRTDFAQSSINSSNEYSFKIPSTQNARQVLGKIEKNPTLSSLVGNKHIRTCITFTGKKDAFVTDSVNSPTDYPLLEGASSVPHPYADIVWKSYVNYDLDLRDRLNEQYRLEAEKENKRSPKVIGLGNLEQFKSPKIFIRLSDTRITATYTDKVVCGDLSLYVLTLPNLKNESTDLSIYYLLGILNSRLITSYMLAKNLIRNLRTGTPQIRLKDIRNIPIPLVPRADQNDIVVTVKKLLDLNGQQKAQPKDTENYQSISEDIERELKSLDNIVLKLYKLSGVDLSIMELGQ